MKMWGKWLRTRKEQGQEGKRWIYIPHHAFPQPCSCILSSKKSDDERTNVNLEFGVETLVLGREQFYLRGSMASFA